MLTLHMGFAIRVYLHVESHRVAADGAVLDVVLVRTPGDIHGHHDFFAAGVADIRRLKVGGPSSAAAFRAFLGHGTEKCSPFNRVEFLSRMAPHQMNLPSEKRAFTAASLPNDESIVQPTFFVPSTCRGS